MADELKDQRVVTMMSPSELEAIDDWSFKNRFRSRGEAIRRLTQMGMLLDRQFEEFASHMRSPKRMEATEVVVSASKSIGSDEKTSEQSKYYALVIYTHYMEMLGDVLERILFAKAELEPLKSKMRPSEAIAAITELRARIEKLHKEGGSAGGVVRLLKEFSEIYPPSAK